ncbi:threonine-phosphate decarboxylase, partial [Klebsiella oxytoca]
MVMLHSLTKQYMVPGLRIGYAVGSGAIMDRLRGLRMPWSVNSVAISAAHYLIDNSWQYRIDAVPLHNEACRLVR